jgi:hypothetical protein
MKRPGRLKEPYSMQNLISMAEFQTTEGHGHPALDIGGQEDERPIFDNVFEPGIQGFEDKIGVGFTGEDVYQLWTRSGEGHGIGSSALGHTRVVTR